MRTFTFIMMLSVIIVAGCKSGEGGEAYDIAPIDREANLPTADNSRTSLDWTGVYEGTTPCADCDGIKTTLRLNDDEIIVEAKDITIRFQVGENEVTMLDMAGNVVTGELANFYVLKKN